MGVSYPGRALACPDDNFSGLCALPAVRSPEKISSVCDPALVRSPEVSSVCDPKGNRAPDDLNFEGRCAPINDGRAPENTEITEPIQSKKNSRPDSVFVKKSENDGLFEKFNKFKKFSFYETEHPDHTMGSKNHHLFCVNESFVDINRDDCLRILKCFPFIDEDHLQKLKVMNDTEQILLYFQNQFRSGDWNIHDFQKNEFKLFLDGVDLTKFFLFHKLFFKTILCPSDSNFETLFRKYFPDDLVSSFFDKYDQNTANSESVFNFFMVQFYQTSFRKKDFNSIIENYNLEFLMSTRNIFAELKDINFFEEDEKLKKKSNKKQKYKVINLKTATKTQIGRTLHRNKEFLKIITNSKRTKEQVIDNFLSIFKRGIFSPSILSKWKNEKHLKILHGSFDVLNHLLQLDIPDQKLLNKQQKQRTRQRKYQQSNKGKEAQKSYQQSNSRFISHNVVFFFLPGKSSIFSDTISENDLDSFSGLDAYFAM